MKIDELTKNAVMSELSQDFLDGRELLEFDEVLNVVQAVVKTALLPLVSQQRELLAAFQRDYNKRNFEGSLIADQDIELFLAANCG